MSIQKKKNMLNLHFLMQSDLYNPYRFRNMLRTRMISKLIFFNHQIKITFENPNIRMCTVKLKVLPSHKEYIMQIKGEFQMKLNTISVIWFEILKKTLDWWHTVDIIYLYQRLLKIIWKTLTIFIRVSAKSFQLE